MELFKLFGTILVDNDRANKQLDETDAKAGKVGRTLGSMITTAAKWGAGIAAGAAAGAAALGGLVVRAANAAGEIVRVSQATGFTTKGFQQWDSVMKTVGFSMEQAQGDLAALAERAMDAANGVGEGKEMFDALGVSVTDTSGRLKSQEQIFNEVIASLQSMEDVTRRNAIASALLNTTGEELVPILNMTNDELERMKANAHVIDDESLQRGERFRLTWHQVRESLSILATDIGLKVLPMFQGLIDWTAENVPKIGPIFQFVGEVVGIVFKYLRLIIGDGIAWIRDRAIGPFTEWLIAVWQERGPPIVEAVQKLWDGVKAVFSAIFDVLRGLWDTFILAFQGDWAGAWERLKETFVSLWNRLPELFTGILNPLINVADQIMQAIIGVIRSVFGDEVAGIFETAWDAVKAVFEGARDILLGIWTALTAAFQGDWDTAWDAILGVVQTAWDTIGTVIESALQIINTVVDGALNGIVALVRWAFGDEAADVVDQAFDAIRLIVDTATDVIMGIVRAFSALFRGDWQTAWDEVKGVASTIWNALPAIFESAINGLVGIADTVMTAVIGVIRNLFGDNVADHFQAVWDAVVGVFEAARDNALTIWRALTAAFQGDWQTAWDEIKTIPERSISAIIGVVESSLSAVSGVVDAILNGIVELFRRVFDDEIAAHVERGFEAVRTIIANAQDLILGTLNTLLALVRGDWEGAWETIVQTVQSVWNRTIGLVDGMSLGVRQSIVNLVLRLVDTFTLAKDMVIERVRDLANGVAEWLGETKIGKAFAWLGDQINKVAGWFFELYDKVVGHSYIPDMVEEIGQAIERLREKLANPVARYTSEALKSFEGLSDGAAVAAMSIAEAFDNALGSIGQNIGNWITDMTAAFFNGTATWASVLNSFAGLVGSTMRTLFNTIAVEFAKNLITQNAWITQTLANVATAVSALISQAYATLVAFYAWSGPAAPVLAGATIAAAIAAIAAIGGQAIRAIFPSLGGGGGAPTPPSGTDTPDTSPGGGTSAGRQVSEITGPTRDLLTDLLSPLVSLNTLTGIGERIYNLLYERLPMPGMMLAGAGVAASVGGISVTIESGAVQVIRTGGDDTDIDDETLNELAERLANLIEFKLRGAGQ